MNEYIPEQYRERLEEVNDELFFVALELQDVTQRYYSLIAARIALAAEIRGYE